MKLLYDHHTASTLLANTAAAIYSSSRPPPTTPARNQTLSDDSSQASAKRAVVKGQANVVVNNGASSSSSSSSSAIFMEDQRNRAAHDQLRGDSSRQTGDDEYSSRGTSKPYFPYAIGAGAFVVLVLIAAILAFVIVKRRRKTPSTGSSTSIPANHQNRRSIVVNQPMTPKFIDHVTPTRQQSSATSPPLPPPTPHRVPTATSSSDQSNNHRRIMTAPTTPIAATTTHSSSGSRRQATSSAGVISNATSMTRTTTEAAGGKTTMIMISPSVEGTSSEVVSSASSRVTPMFLPSTLSEDSVSVSRTDREQQQMDQREVPVENCGPSMPSLMRIKGNKGGLLERRGSSASLTIDLNPIVVESFRLPTPHKECSTMEYLMSAGNRLTRRQLRHSIKNTKALQEEFLDIPLNHARKLDIAGCNNKNRYKSIWPNEESRVIIPRRSRPTRRCSTAASTACQIDDQTNVISSPTISARRPKTPTSKRFTFDFDQAVSQDVCEEKMDFEEAESSSDGYINANYVRGYDNEPKSYIATQGPLPSTIDDFWSMVWHEHCPCIVMMTLLQENNRVKCENYLPNTDAQYGDIRVTVKSVACKGAYYVRELILENGDEQRRLKHFWFTGWPDHKAPASTSKQLIELVQDVELERQHSRCRPVLVHCSAGLGRSGCFIATSIGMRQLREEDAVDILGIVCQLRVDRGGMIQTVEQYEFIHHALIQYERHLPETPSSNPPLTPLSTNCMPPNHSNSQSRSSSKYEF